MDKYFVYQDQVIYLPPHANGDIYHPDVEFGFVTSVAPSKKFVYVRYWSKFDPKDLRTKANSECTPIEYLDFYDRYPRSLIREMCEKYGIEKEHETTTSLWDTLLPPLR